MGRTALSLGSAVALVVCLCLAASPGSADEPARDAAAAVPGSTPSPPAAPAGAERHFDIMEYDVDGNTVLQNIDIEKAVYPFLGEGRTAADVDRARDALERAYQTHGYQTVQVEIPRQSGEGGIIHLHVAEARIERLRVVNAHYYLPSDIRKDAPSLAEGTVPNINDVQKDIIALNQLPDRKVTPVLRAGEEPGTLDADLQVDDQLPLHSSIELNNRKSQSTTELRANATISYDNLWQAGHSLSLSSQIAPQNPSNAEVYAASYLARFPGSPVSLQLNFIHSNSNVTTVGSTDVIGKGDIIGLRAIMALWSTPTFTQSVIGGFDYKHFQESTSFGGSGSQTPVTYYPFTVAYNANLQEADGVDQGTVSLNFAFPGFGSGTPEFDDKRFEASPQFAYLKTNLNRVQNLPFGASGLVLVEGQLTSQPLISNEQFSAGGDQSVRGYLEAEQLGDYGVRSTVELRSPSLAERLSTTINDLHFLVFLDEAALWLHQVLPDQAKQASLASVGLGMRLRLLDHFNGSLDLAYPLLNSVATRRGDWRPQFRIWSDY